MPKSKVRKKPEGSASRSSSYTAPVKSAAPSPTWYPVVMTIVLILGLAYLVAYYIASSHIGFMVSLGAWNFAVGFGILVVGLVMAVRWR